MPNFSKPLLHYATFGDNTKPAVVFLHGFLGSHRDWLAIIERMKTVYFCVAVDLPGHGLSQHINCADFTQLSETITHSIQSILGSKAYYLLGYSLGGRIAMYLAAKIAMPNLKGLIVESCHLGLPESERAARCMHDMHWSQRFLTESMQKVLIDWYQQALFSSLSDEQKLQLISVRMKGLTEYSEKKAAIALAKILLACSLSKQPLFTAQDFKHPLLYLCGELDKKFTTIAMESGLVFKVLKKAGHNIHFEQPSAFVQIVLHWLKKQEKNQWQKR